MKCATVAIRTIKSICKLLANIHETKTVSCVHKRSMRHAVAEHIWLYPGMNNVINLRQQQMLFLAFGLDMW